MTISAGTSIPLIIVGLASSALTFLISSVWKPYLKRYAEEMAKHLASQENFRELLKQEFDKTLTTEMAKQAVSQGFLNETLSAAFAKAALEETAKREAAHKDFERMLSEMGKITAATKTIETKVSEGYWLRQMIWTQKRDTYMRILQAFADVENNWLSMADLLTRFGDREFDPDAERAFDKELEEIRQGVTTAARELDQSCSVAQLMLSETAATVAINAAEKIMHDQAFDDLLSTQAGQDGLLESLKNVRKYLANAREQLVRAARVELQLDASVEFQSPGT